MTEESSSPGFDLFTAIVIVVRVILILGLWIALFLTLFLGYFTYPVVILGFLTVVYALLELGLRRWTKRRRRLKSERQDFIQARSEKVGKKE